MSDQWDDILSRAVATLEALREARSTGKFGIEESYVREFNAALSSLGDRIDVREFGIAESELKKRKKVGVPGGIRGTSYTTERYVDGRLFRMKCDKALGYLHSKERDIPRLSLVPDAVRRGRLYVIEPGDVRTEEDLAKLLGILWLEPEAHVFYYHPVDTPVDEALLAASRCGDLIIESSERHYYKHPNFDRDYVRILPSAPGFAWERVAQKGVEHWRELIRLSARKREELNIQRKIEIEEEFRNRVRNRRYAYDVFLSYSKADSEEAQGLHEQIETGGYRAFLAPKSIQAGDDFAEEIRHALHGSREVWLLMSPASLKSEWVTSEWGAAWVLGKRIVPILHRCSPESLPDRLRRLECIDFHRSGELVEHLGSSFSRATKGEY